MSSEEISFVQGHKKLKLKKKKKKKRKNLYFPKVMEAVLSEVTETLSLQDSLAFKEKK